MVNFNLQDGYSVLTIPSKNPSLDDIEDDVNVDKMPPLLDSNNLIHYDQLMSDEVPTATSVLLVQGVQFKHAGNFSKLSRRQCHCLNYLI